MEYDLYADLELSNSEGEDGKPETTRQDGSQAEMDLMDEGLTNKFKVPATPKSASQPRVDIELEKLKHENALLKQQNAILEKNLALVYKTAHHILNKKDKELNNLRTKYDAMCFRRSDQANPSALPSIAPRTERSQTQNARAPDPPVPAPSISRQFVRQPERRALSSELAMLSSYSKGQTGSATAAVGATSTATKSGESSDRSSSDAGNRDEKLIESSLNQRGSSRPPIGSEKDKNRKQNAKSPRDGLRSQTTAAGSSRSENRNDRKRPRGSPEMEIEAKRSRGQQPESYEGHGRHRSSRSPRSNPGKCTRDHMRASGSEERREGSAEDRRRRHHTEVRRKGDVDSSRRGRADSIRGSSSESTSKHHSGSDRKRSDSPPAGDLRKKHSRTTRHSDRAGPGHEDTRQDRSASVDSTKNKTARSSKTEKVHRESDSKAESALEKSDSVLRNRRTSSLRRDSAVAESKGGDGSAKRGNASPSRNDQKHSPEPVPKKVPKERDDGSTRKKGSVVKTHDVHDAVKSVLKSITPKKLPDNRRLNGADSGSNRVSRSPEANEETAMSARVEKVDSSEENGATKKNSPSNHIPNDSEPLLTAAPGTTSPSRVKVESPREARTEVFTSTERSCSKDVSVSQGSKPGHSSKPTLDAMKEAAECRSETPTGVKVTQCDIPRATGGVGIDTKVSIPRTMISLRRSPRKCMKAERDTKLREDNEKVALQIPVGNLPLKLKEADIKPSMLQPMQEAPKSLPLANVCKNDVVELRRSPRKSVRDRQVLATVANSQPHGAIESPHTIRPTPPNLHRRGTREILMDPIGPCRDPRVPRDALRPMILRCIAPWTLPLKKESPSPPACDPSASWSSSPRRSPQAFGAKRLTEGDASLLQSLLNDPQTKHFSSAKNPSPRTQKDLTAEAYCKPHTSFYAAAWLDDGSFDPSKPPETPGKNLDFSKLAPRRSDENPGRLLAFDEKLIIGAAQR